MVSYMQCKQPPMHVFGDSNGLFLHSWKNNLKIEQN